MSEIFLTETEGVLYFLKKIKQSEMTGIKMSVDDRNDHCSWLMSVAQV